MVGRILERIIIELGLLGLSPGLGFVCWNLLALVMTLLEGPGPFTYRERFADYLGELRRAFGSPSGLGGADAMARSQAEQLSAESIMKRTRCVDDWVVDSRSGAGLASAAFQTRMFGGG